MVIVVMKRAGTSRLSAKLPQTENQYWRFRELFFNGKRQIRARYPNFDPQEPDFGGWAFIESTVPDDAPAATSFRYEVGAFPRRWARPDQGEIFTASPRLPCFDRPRPRGSKNAITTSISWPVEGR